MLHCSRAHGGVRIPLVILSVLFRLWALPSSVTARATSSRLRSSSMRSYSLATRVRSCACSTYTHHVSNAVPMRSAHCLACCYFVINSGHMPCCWVTCRWKRHPQPVHLRHQVCLVAAAQDRRAYGDAAAENERTHEYHWRSREQVCCMSC